MTIMTCEMNRRVLTGTSNYIRIAPWQGPSCGLLTVAYTLGLFCCSANAGCVHAHMVGGRAGLGVRVGAAGFVGGRHPGGGAAAGLRQRTLQHCRQKQQSVFEPC